MNRDDLEYMLREQDRQRRASIGCVVWALILIFVVPAVFSFLVWMGFIFVVGNLPVK